MLELIAIVIFLVGFIGMSLIILRKLSVLAELVPEEVEGPGIIERAKDKFRNSRILKSFSPEILLQRVLSWVRILTLKTESKTRDWLKQLRQKNKNKFSDDYWRKLRKNK